MRKFCYLLAAFAMVAFGFVAAQPASAQDAGSSTYRITFMNMTSGQPMTPPVVAIHDSAAVQLYEVGSAAGAELQAIAENGDNGPLVALAGTLPASTLSAAGVAAPDPAGPILPGESSSIELTTDATGHALSLVAMVVCTNDAFTGLNSVALPAAGETATFDLLPYDAGTETNDLDADYWVPPCGGSGNNMHEDENGVIAAHPGQTGVGDFDFAGDVKVAAVTVENITAAAPVEITVPLNPTGDPDGSGTATLTFDSAGGEVCFDITVADIATPGAAHIHVGTAGDNGPVLIDFDVATNGLQGCAPASADDIAAVLADPADHYLNVHNADAPAGAVRAQLDKSAAAAPTPTPTPAPTGPTWDFDITFTNISPGQPMTPPVFAIHDRAAVRLFEVGSAASAGLQAIAENGDNGPLVALAGTLPLSTLSAAGVGAPTPPGPLFPGDSVTVTASTLADNHTFSMVAMVVCTNDGFTGIDAAALPTDANPSVEYILGAYDAGTETNDLDADYWVPPCGGSGDNLHEDENGVITSHPGQTGVGDFDFASDQAMMRVRIVKTNAVAVAPTAVPPAPTPVIVAPAPTLSPVIVSPAAPVVVVAPTVAPVVVVAPTVAPVVVAPTVAPVVVSSVPAATVAPAAKKVEEKPKAVELAVTGVESPLAGMLGLALIAAGAAAMGMRRRT